MTPARICPRNIYLNLSGRAHFHWRSLKACNIAKKTCLNDVWTVILPLTFCSLKLQILRLFRGRIPKIIKRRFTLKCQKSHWRCSVRREVLNNFAKFTGKHLCQSLFFTKGNFSTVSCEFCEISRTPILQNNPDDCVWRVRDIIIIYSYS